MCHDIGSCCIISSWRETQWFVIGCCWYQFNLDLYTHFVGHLFMFSDRSMVISSIMLFGQPNAMICREIKRVRPDTSSRLGVCFLFIQVAVPYAIFKSPIPLETISAECRFFVRFWRRLFRGFKNQLRIKLGKPTGWKFPILPEMLQKACTTWVILGMVFAWGWWVLSKCRVRFQPQNVRRYQHEVVKHFTFITRLKESIW